MVTWLAGRTLSFRLLRGLGEERRDSRGKLLRARQVYDTEAWQVLDHKHEIIKLNGQTPQVQLPDTCINIKTLSREESKLL